MTWRIQALVRKARLIYCPLPYPPTIKEEEGVEEKEGGRGGGGVGALFLAL